MLVELLKGIASQEEVLRYYNAYISYIKLPKSINGLVFNYKDIKTVFINKNLSYYKKKRTILHELAHIELSQLEQIDNDLFAFKVDNYEDEADRYINFIEDNIKLENKELEKLREYV